MIVGNMDRQSGVERDIAVLRSLIDGPEAGLGIFMADRPDLRSADEARDDLARTVLGLEDVRSGRTVSHSRIVADVAARRRNYGTQAAE